MAYLGNQPALSYTSFAKQDFTTSATTSYTLDNPVANANELALFINFVRQEPTTAYTASGTSLTLTSATSASDDMYCVFLGKAVQTVNPPSGSVGLSQLSATGTPSSSTFLRGDNSWVAAGGANTPAFSAYLSADQTGISSGTLTKIQFDTKHFDTDSLYDNTTNYRFTPNVAGKYHFYFNCRINNSNGNSNLASTFLSLYKNGAYSRNVHFNPTANYGNSWGLTLSAVVEANGTTDYFEVYVYGLTVSGTIGLNGDAAGDRSFFGAYKIIE